MSSTTNEEIGDAIVNKNEPQVLKANNRNGRKWDKKHACPYCSKLYAKMARHLEQMHNEELDVASALSSAKGSKERNTRLSLIRYKGNFMHNTEVLRQGEGTIIPGRRPSKAEHYQKFLPCGTCLRYVSKKGLWKHKKKCLPSKGRTTPGAYQRESLALLPVSVQVRSEFRDQVLNNMAADTISRLCRNDELIISFGQKLYRKAGNNVRQHQYVKQKMREVGRLLLTLRGLDDTIITLKDCIHPAKFKLICDGVRAVSGYKDGTYEKPSLALKLGHSLKKCGNLLRSNAIQNEDKNLQQKAEDFLILIENDWNSEVSHQSLNTLSERKYNKPQNIPLAEDIKKLNDFLRKEAAVQVEQMKANPGVKAWRELCEVTLTQVVLFNRRRSGEVEQMTLKNFTKGIANANGSIQEEIRQSLTKFEQELAKHMKRIELRGKKGRKVAVLLTKSHAEQLELLVNSRDTVGVHEDNDMLFPRPGHFRTPIRSCDTIRKFAQLCGAKEPTFLRSTALRKHIAVISQLLNLKKNEMDILAGFLGHDIRIHREFYRLPEETLQRNSSTGKSRKALTSYGTWRFIKVQRKDAR